MSAAVAADASPIPFQWAKTITDDTSDLEEIVEDVLTAGGMSIVYGESNSGKTTMVLDLAMRMTAERDWLGKRTRCGACIYVGAESPGSIKRRLTAYRQNGGAIHAFGLIPCTLNLLAPSVDLENLIDLISEKQGELTERSPLRLIVIDTVARVMAGANENAGEDMSRLITAGDRIRSETGAHVVFIHHSGKDSAKGARGHSSLRAAVDTEIEVTVEGDLHIATVTKQRDLGTNGLRLSARFKPIDLGTNTWGKPITACVVEAIEPPSAHMAALMRQTDDAHAERVVVSGFKRLREMGIETTDGVTSRSHLPRQLLEKGLAEGCSKDDLVRAVNRLLVAKTFRVGTVGKYGNGTDRPGLVLTSDPS